MGGKLKRFYFYVSNASRLFIYILQKLLIIKEEPLIDQAIFVLFLDLPCLIKTPKLEIYK